MIFGIPVAEPLKSWAQIASNIGSVAAIVAAAVWFFRTSKAKQRIQFDIDCKVYEIPDNPNQKVAEVQFIFENKGFVEHRIYDLTVSIHSLNSEGRLEVEEKTGELQFQGKVLSMRNIVPKKLEWYFIRPGVRQMITHIVPIPTNVSLIRITAGFKYHEGAKDPHTVRRVFATKPIDSRVPQVSL